MHVIIVGSGRTGKYVIESAVRDHWDVYVIEKNQERANSIATDYECIVINADASLESLKQAKAEKADAIVVTTDDDAINAFVTILAKKLGVKRLVSVVNNDKLLSIFEHLDIDTVENPDRLMGKHLYGVLQESTSRKFPDLGEEFELLKRVVDQNSQISKKPIRDLKREGLLPAQSLIIKIKRRNRSIIPEGETKILVNDSVEIILKKNSVEEVSQLFDTQYP